MIAALKNASKPEPKVELDAMRERVRKKIIEPYQKANMADSDERKLKGRLRTRGYYL